MTDPLLRLFELVLNNGRSASPYVWRSRYALAHKGLAFESVPMGFTEIPHTFGGRFKTLPVLAHGDAHVGDSWEIAHYLDKTFSDKPLFSSDAERAAVRLTDEWFAAVVMRKFFGMYVLDVHDAARPADRAYFRQSREARFKGTPFEGRTLEEFTAERAGLIPQVREALQPLRQQLGRHPFLGGRSPSYADYIVLGGFHWVASVSTMPPLDDGDTVLSGWWDRCLDLYGGMGRDPRMHPLFA